MNGDLVGAATLVLVAISDVIAAGVSTPITNTVHGLAAARLGALLKRVLIRTSIAIVQGNLRHLVHTAALVLVISLVIEAFSVGIPGSSAVNRLGTLLRGALLKVVRVRASMAVVLSNGGHLIHSAALVLMLINVVLALAELVPRSDAINGLRARLGRALLVVLGISTLVTAMSGLAGDLVLSALLVLVIICMVGTGVIRSPSSQAVHRLGTALRRALLEGMHIRAAKSIVSHAGRDLVDLAVLVLMGICVISTRIIRAPSTNAVHGLAAFASRALNLAILIGASSATEISLRGDLVGAAALISVAILDMVAAGVWSPLALAIHRLAAARLGAVLEIVLVRASEAIVQGSLRHLIQAAALIFVRSLIVGALAVGFPSANTVHGLGTLLHSAFLVLIGVRASMAIVLCDSGHLVQPASPVPVIILVIAGRVLIPIADTIDRLSTRACNALHVSISIRASIAVVQLWPGHAINPALLVLVLLLEELAFTILSKLTEAVDRLGAARSSALLVGLSVRAAVTVVGNIGRDLVDPAALVLVGVSVMEAVVIRSKFTSAVNRLAAFFCGALNRVILIRTRLAVEGSNRFHLVGMAALVLVAISNMSASTIRFPVALAVHGLAAARLGALLRVLIVRAGEAIMQGLLRDLILAATLVGVVTQDILTVIPGSPATDTIDRLGTAVLCAFLVHVRVWAGMSTELRGDRNLVKSAPLVVVAFRLIRTVAISIPRTNTVDWLRASLSGTLNVAIQEGASVPIMLFRASNDVRTALLVLMLSAVILAALVGIPQSNAINRLRTSNGRALLVSMSVRASITIV